MDDVTSTQGSTVSSHVLDTTAGRPAEGIALTLLAADGIVLGQGRTDADGRVSAIGPMRLEAGDYRLRFATGDWFARHEVTAFYPEVVIAFTITDPQQHYHVPVLLNPFGYATYRGS